MTLLVVLLGISLQNDCRNKTSVLQGVKRDSSVDAHAANIYKKLLWMEFLFSHVKTIQSSSDIHQLLAAIVWIKQKLKNSLCNSNVSLWDLIASEACGVGLKSRFGWYFGVACFQRDERWKQPSFCPSPWVQDVMLLWQHIWVVFEESGVMNNF